MENSKISLIDLAKALAKRKKLAQREADAFVRAFFDLIQEQLLAGETVKIKGFGTFKITEVGSRESVNVNTGERFTIEGHNKVSFTPDKTLADHVNRPFAEFETVVLNEGTSTEEMERIDTPAEVIPTAEEEAPAVEETLVEEETPADKEAPVEEDAPVEEEVPVDLEERVIPLAPIAEIPAEENPVEEEVEPAEEDTMVEETPVENTTTEEDSTEDNNTKKVEPTPRKRRIWPWILFLIFLLALAAGAYYFFKVYVPRQVVDKPSCENPVKPIEPDTIDKIDTTAVEPVAVEPEKPKYNLDSIQIKYAQIENGEYWIVGTKTIHELQKGEDLSKLADKYYGDRRLISYIIKHNHYRNSDLERMFVGVKVEIPELVNRKDL